MKQLPIVTYKIQKGEYLSDIEPFRSKGLETDTIYDKTETGLGITHAALIRKMNLILVIPPVPCIEIKALKHLNALAVYKGITTTDVEAYLKNSTYPKKIMCTPEAYIDKVSIAISKSQFDLYKDFFMLLDECDKLVTDVDYRSKITAPIQDFFKFTNKAMVSATVIQPSYKKFYEQNFKIVRIEPQYNYKKNINLITTNNITSSIRSIIEQERQYPLFIFLNSTVTIDAIIKMLDIASETKVFCAKDSVRELRLRGIDNAVSKLGDYARFNILTSRFFSAVDIDLPYKPDIVMITDILSATHSILDPAVEVVQICGRFRNGRGEITHLTNFNPSIVSKSEDSAREFLNGGYSAFTNILTSYKKAKGDGEKSTFKEALSLVGIAKYVDDEDQLDDFMVDNFVHEEKVRGYYKHSSSLLKAYEDSNHFEVYPTKHQLPVSDEDNMNIVKAKSQASLCKAVAEALEKYHEPYLVGTFRFFDANTEINKLKVRYPEIYEFYVHLGIDQMRYAEFNKRIMKSLLKNKLKLDEIYKADLVKDVFKSIIPMEFPVEEQLITDKLQQLYTKHGITFEARAQQILRYFRGRRTTTKGNHAYILSEKADIESLKNSWRQPEHNISDDLIIH